MQVACWVACFGFEKLVNLYLPSDSMQDFEVFLVNFNTLLVKRIDRF